MKKISFFNPKGGAGKTVSAVNIAYALVRKNKKVLLIDCDARSAVQIYLNIEHPKNIYNLITDNYNYSNVNIEDYITNKNGLDIIISTPFLSKLDYFFEIEDNDKQGIFYSIKNLMKYFQEYDYVIFDTEGTINNLNTAILNTTDYIFAPTKISEIDLNGIMDIVHCYETIKKINDKLEIKEVFLIDVNQRTKIYSKSKENLTNYLKDKNIEISEISIRHDHNIVVSMEQNKDIFSFRNSSNAAIDYRNLVDEFLESED